MRRLGQFIRQANHFGKPTIIVETAHQFARTNIDFGKHCFRRRKNSSENYKGVEKMKTVTKEFQMPATIAVMFACLSVISTAMTAVMPLVVTA
jgi:hypothetical protein